MRLNRAYQELGVIVDGMAGVGNYLKRMATKLFGVHSVGHPGGSTNKYILKYHLIKCIINSIINI